MLDDRHGDTFVAFEHVQKSYDGQTLVVKDLNLSIGKGEFLTMLGPSGSGKTTCLMMLAGFETATHGEIRLAGRPFAGITTEGEMITAGAGALDSMVAKASAMTITL